MLYFRKCFSTLLCLIAFVFYSTIAIALPGQIILIRHGEKLPRNSGLSPAGEKRAQALVAYFTETPELLKFGEAVAIYAAAPNHEDSSTRPFDTVKPTADKLGLTVNTNYTREKNKYIGTGKPSVQTKMAKEILNNPDYKGKNIIICWEHHTLPDLIMSLNGPNIGKWEDDVFNKTIILTYNNDGTVTIQKLQQPF